MPDINVATEGIQKLLQKLNVNKASGLNMLPAMILKDLSEVIPPSSAQYIRNAWTQDQSLIYGKQQMSRQSSRKVRSLKPITIELSPCISCKMFEHIIMSNIMRHLDKNNFLFTVSMVLDQGGAVRHSYLT